MSPAEYVEGMNTVVEEGRSDFVGIVEAFSQIEDPTVAQAAAFLDDEVTIRRRFLKDLDGLDPPDSLADLHMILRGAFTRLLSAAEALADFARDADTIEAIEVAPERLEYDAANEDGSTVCFDVQARLDDLATEAPINNSWIPDLRLTVQAALGCGEIEPG